MRELTKPSAEEVAEAVRRQAESHYSARRATIDALLDIEQRKAGKDVATVARILRAILERDTD